VLNQYSVLDTYTYISAHSPFRWNLLRRRTANGELLFMFSAVCFRRSGAKNI